MRAYSNAADTLLPALTQCSLGKCKAGCKRAHGSKFPVQRHNPLLNSPSSSSSCSSHSPPSASLSRGSGVSADTSTLIRASIYLQQCLTCVCVCVCMSPLTGVLACLMFWLGISLTSRLVGAHPIQSQSLKRTESVSTRRNLHVLSPERFGPFAAETSLAVLFI